MVLKSKLHNQFFAMLNDFESFPIDEMIERHKSILGQATVPKELADLNKCWEKEDEEERLRSQGIPEQQIKMIMKSPRMRI